MFNGCDLSNSSSLLGLTASLVIVKHSELTCGGAMVIEANGGDFTESQVNQNTNLANFDDSIFNNCQIDELTR